MDLLDPSIFSLLQKPSPNRVKRGSPSSATEVSIPLCHEQYQRLLAYGLMRVQQRKVSKSENLNGFEFKIKYISGLQNQFYAISENSFVLIYRGFEYHMTFIMPDQSLDLSTKGSRHKTWTSRNLTSRTTCTTKLVRRNVLFD